MHIRRVGFRFGTDAELAAMHLVESEIEAERWPDTALVEAGSERWTIFVREPDGQCVGGTEITFDPWQPVVAFQQNTAIHPSTAAWVSRSGPRRRC